MAQSSATSSQYTSQTPSYNPSTGRYQPSYPRYQPSPSGTTRYSPRSPTRYSPSHGQYGSGASRYTPPSPSLYRSSPSASQSGVVYSGEEQFINQYGAEPLTSGTGVIGPRRYIGDGRLNADTPSFWGMTIDLLLVRPAGLVATAAGSVVYLISLPFTLTAGWHDVAAERFVAQPARNTFGRPLGTSWDNPDPSEEPVPAL